MRINICNSCIEKQNKIERLEVKIKLLKADIYLIEKDLAEKIRDNNKKLENKKGISNE